MDKHIAQNIQDAFLNTSRREKTTVTFHLMHGEPLSGTIKSFDKFSVLLDIDHTDVLVFKHAIASISVEKKKEDFKVKYLGRKTDNT